MPILSRRLLAALLGPVVLTVSMTAPADAAEHAAQPPIVGAFALGDGLEASIDERVGAVRIALPVAGLTLAWDSRALDDDRYALGGGWSWNVVALKTAGGLEVAPPSGGSFRPDPTHPSGLAGYAVEDVVFEATAGSLPGRAVPGPPTIAAQAPESVAYAYLLHELGGVRTYFNDDGDPVARLDRFDARTDWAWDETIPHRLTAVVDADGLVTEVDWTSDPGRVLVKPGANAPSSAGGGTVWSIESDGRRVASVTDATGDRVAFDALDGSGLISSILAASGGATSLDWRTPADGLARVAGITTRAASGAELSRREWRAGGDGTAASGWPAYAGESDVFWSGDPAFRYVTELTDGATRVVSEYNSQHLLVRRSTIVTTPSGQQLPHDQTLAYPGTEDGGVPDPEALPGNWSRPRTVAVTYRDGHGGERTAVETFEFDARGRAVRHTTPDSSETTTAYDEEVPDGLRLPVGLPVGERVLGPDGRTQLTSHTLDPRRTSVVATETLLGDSVGDEMITARSEFRVSSDGVLVEQRDFPDGDHGEAPRVTVWDRTVDLERGIVTATETVGSGTSAETTTTETASLVHGGVLSRTDPVGNTSHVEYDAIGRQVLIRDALGRTTTTRYTSAQRDGRNAMSSTTPDGVTVTEIRDELGRSIRILDDIDDGTVTPGFERVAETRTYPEPGVVAVTDAWGATSITRHDVFGRQVETVMPSGLVQLTRYDDVASTVTTALSPTGRLDDAELVRTETRDVRGRTTATTGRRADGEPALETTAEYDGLGRGIAASDGTLETRVRHDPLGRPAVVSRGDLSATRTFDGFGTSREKTLADADGSRSGGTRAFDAVGRTEVETDQAGRATRIEYAPDGLALTSATDDGHLTEHRYDPATRLPLETTVTAPGAEPVRTAYVYDPASDRVIGVFDPRDPDGSMIAYTYDAFGNRTSVTYPDGRSIAHAYDRHGRRIATTDVAGNTTTLTHTTDGLPARADQRAPDGTPIAAASYTYDEHRRMTALDRGNGVVTEYTFTSASEIATETTIGPTGRTQSHRAYAYDAHGNLLRRTDTVTPDARGERDDAPRVTTTEYVYDAHDRLTASTVHADGGGRGDGDGDPEPFTRTTTYRLSASGDVLDETTVTTVGGSGEQITITSSEYGPLGQLLARTRTDRGPGSPAAPGDDAETRQLQTWDAAGNLLHGADGTRYAYDAAHRPVVESDADGTVTATRYWADGTRRDRTVTPAAGGGASTTGFYWDGSTLVNDTHTGPDPDDTGYATYLLGAARHTRTAVSDAGRSVTGYYGTDRHGNVVDTTDPRGATIRRVSYTDYGSSTGGTSTAGLQRDPFGYAGGYTERSGRQWLGERTYDPVAMQFTTRDVAALHNRYAYADLNPITKSDPTGREPAPDGWHQAIIGLALLATAVIAVIAIATCLTPPATLGAFGVFAAIGGGLADAYALALGIGGLVVASRSATSFADEQARAFFESDAAWISELTVGIGIAAATYFLAKTVPRAVAWLRSTFASPAQPQGGSFGPPAVAFELKHLSEIAGESMTDSATKIDRITRPSELIGAWEQQISLVERNGPISFATERFEQVLNRTASALSREPDAFATVCTLTITHGDTTVTGFRAWLYYQHGVTLEFSMAAYEYAGHTVRRPLAERLQPLLDRLLRAGRLYRPDGDHQRFAQQVIRRRNELYDVVEQIDRILSRPSALELF